MSFAWADFLGVADALIALDDAVIEEARQRSAISRAYYAVFGTARARASVLRLTTRKSSAEHGEIESFYAKRHGETGAEIAKLLQRMRTMRNVADYDETIDNLATICRDTLADARTALHLLAAL